MFTLNDLMAVLRQEKTVNELDNQTAPQKKQKTHWFNAVLRRIGINLTLQKIHEARNVHAICTHLQSVMFNGLPPQRIVFQRRQKRCLIAYQHDSGQLYTLKAYYPATPIQSVQLKATQLLPLSHAHLELYLKANHPNVQFETVRSALRAWQKNQQKNPSHSPVFSVSVAPTPSYYALERPIHPVRRKKPTPANRIETNQLVPAWINSETEDTSEDDSISVESTNSNRSSDTLSDREADEFTATEEVALIVAHTSKDDSLSVVGSTTTDWEADELERALAIISARVPDEMLSWELRLRTPLQSPPPCLSSNDLDSDSELAPLSHLLHGDSSLSSQALTNLLQPQPTQTFTGVRSLTSLKRTYSNSSSEPSPRRICTQAQRL